VQPSPKAIDSKVTWLALTGVRASQGSDPRRQVEDQGKRRQPTRSHAHAPFPAVLMRGLNAIRERRRWWHAKDNKRIIAKRAVALRAIIK
jgi:hypothetical protein